MTHFEVVSVLLGLFSTILALLAVGIALWNAKSASRQAVAVENQSVMGRIHELETLYAARVTDLTQKYETVQMESNLHKRHAQRCEEELAKLAGPGSHVAQPLDEGTH